MKAGHHFFGRTASEYPQIEHVSCTHTGFPVRFARDCTSQAGGSDSSKANSASLSFVGSPWRLAISSGMSRRWAASRLLITRQPYAGLAGVGAWSYARRMSQTPQLRDVVEDDLETLFLQQLDPEASRVANFPSRDRETFMKHWHTKVLGDPTVFVQTVIVDGAIAGSVVAWWEGGKRFIGYWFGREFWGKGIGTESVRQFIERETNRPLYADPFAGNVGSVRLLENCGFRRVGSVMYAEHEHIMFVLDLV